MTDLTQHPVAALDPDAVEVANAHGPYTHGVWAGRTVSVGNEEALSGRGQFMADLIRRSLCERFTPDEMREMTLVDVGCYDGWLLCQLEDLPFARMIGVEPRAKNIEKGRMIRRLLDIDTRCEFRQGSIETLDETLADVAADVVVCAGLFHHLASTADGVARLHAVCRRFLFLETICFPTTLEDQRLREALELKDLPYFFQEPVFGVTGHKLESGYNDGSATRMSVVSLPSVSALKMFLDVQGFTDVRVVAEPETYSKTIAGGWRKFSAVCLTAVRQETAATPVTTWVTDYESGLVRTRLPAAATEALYNQFCHGRHAHRPPLLARAVTATMTASGWKVLLAQRVIRHLVHERYAREIVKNLRYAPRDKVALEHGKNLLAVGRYAEAEQALFGITRRLNADWRSVYRAFCLLAWARRSQGDMPGAHRYETLCLTANPQFPPALLGGGHRPDVEKGA